MLWARIAAGRFAVASPSARACVLAAAVLLLSVTARVSLATEATLNSWWGVDNSGVWDPADPLGAAGPRGLLHVNNDRIRYSDKAGIPYPGFGGFDLRDFFTPPTPPNILNDPRTVYDPQSQRFFITCSDFAASGTPGPTLHAYLSIAVSTNSHPTSPSDWIKYRFEVTRAVGLDRFAPDYPQIGVDEYGLHVTGNYFRLPLDGSTFMSGVGIITFPKAQLLAGGPVTPLTTFISQSDAFTLQPVSLFWSATGPANVSYFVDVPRFTTSGIRLWALADPLGARVLSSAIIASRPHGNSTDLLAPQGNTGVRIRSWSGAAQAMAQWRAGDIWFAATGDTTDAGGIRARAHWYHVATNAFPTASPSLLESGVFDAGPGQWTFLPALGLTPHGDVGIVFQHSSSTTSPAMRFAGRGWSEPSFATPVTVKVSPASATFQNFGSAEKWGDDYTVSADPADSSLWMTCQLARLPQTGDTPSWTHEWANVIFDDNLPGWPASGRRVRQGQSPVAALSIAPDDSGGVHLGWHDMRRVDGQTAVIFAQRLTGTGAHAGGWFANGNAVSEASSNAFVRVVTDGSGGAYVYFMGTGQTATLRVVRVARQGSLAPGWPATPVVVATNVATLIAAAPDGAGGMLAAYSNGALRVQRVGPTGVLAWPTPVAVTTSATQVNLVPDMLGGAFVSWTAVGHARVQHLLASGALDPAWPAARFDLGPGATPRSVADGANGVFVTYAASGDLFARRFATDGSAPAGWASPVTVCAAAGMQSQPVVASDMGGGLLVAWSDLRDPGHDADVFAQRLTVDGAAAPGWPADGVRLCGAPGAQSEPAVAADGGGGAVVSWTDFRAQPDCAIAGCGSDVYWSRVSALGIVDGALAPDGEPAGVAEGDQSSSSIVRTGPQDAIVAWLDGRSTPDGDPSHLTQVFAKRVAFAPGAGVPPPATSPITDGLGPPRPNPTSDGVRFDLALSAASAGRRIELGVFDIGGRLVRRIAPPAPGAAGVQTLEWDLRDADGHRVRNGKYFLRLRIDERTWSRTLTVR